LAFCLSYEIMTWVF